ncbi:60S ribosomal protein L31 [Tupaia chinensis]|uniref:Large ribosomal subunit protein eL31 n=1 Tax=Tupaia chinensis TaxID=246437 RepID=L9KXP9_TUPCH|nr:60S ribosomal protein L31 [Tupaia chinensis]
MAHARKGGEKKKGRSAISEVVTQEYTINIHKRIHGMGFKKRAPRALKESQKFAMKEMGTPDVHIDTRLNKVVRAKGIRHVPYQIRVRLSRKRNEDEDSPNKLYNLVTYVRTCYHFQKSTNSCLLLKDMMSLPFYQKSHEHYDHSYRSKDLRTSMSQYQQEKKRSAIYTHGSTAYSSRSSAAHRQESEAISQASFQQQASQAYSLAASQYSLGSEVSRKAASAYDYGYSHG